MWKISLFLGIWEDKIICFWDLLTFKIFFIWWSKVIFGISYFTCAKLKWEFGSPLTFQGVKVSVCCWTKAGSIKWSRKLWGKWYSSKPKLVAWLNKRSLKLVPPKGKLNVAHGKTAISQWLKLPHQRNIKFNTNISVTNNQNTVFPQIVFSLE